MFLVGMVCVFVYPSAGLFDQTWLGVRCHPEWEFRPLLFSHSWTIQGPESTCTGHCSCFTDLWPKMYMTYARFFPIRKKPQRIKHFRPLSNEAISIYLIPTESYRNRLSRGCNIFSVRFLKNAQALSWYFNP